MPVEQLPEIGFADPAVDARADLDAHGRRDVRGLAEPLRQVGLAEAPFAEQPVDAVAQAGLGLSMTWPEMSSWLPRATGT